jgi:Sulfotransferase domain
MINLTVETLYLSVSLTKMPCDKNHILIACFPKSGSTWLSEVFAQLPEHQRAHLVPEYDRREHELAFERLIVFHQYNYVAQHHCRLSLPTERYLDIFSIKPVILVRNIFDCVISMKEFIDGGDKVDNTIDNRIVWPFAYVPQDYYCCTDSERFNFVIDMFVPWYFNFFVGWQGFSESKWVTYEELSARPEETVRSISDRFSFGLKQSAIKAALEGASRAPTRKNRAQVGRGEILSNAQKDRIHKFARYYPSNDFSMIGL